MQKDGVIQMKIMNGIMMEEIKWMLKIIGEMFK